VTRFTCSKLQDELSQQNQLIESLRVELNTAREEKNAVEHHYSDSLKDIETSKKEYDEVKKSCEVIGYNLSVC